jgi:hypothetical protein
VLATWWPLAASWLLMSLEGPMGSAVIARLPQPEVNLAAWGGIVRPLSLIIEAPIIMLLAASTELSRHRRTYRKVYRFMMWTSAALTVLHALTAFTPLYDVVAGRIIGAPTPTLAPARIGMMVMTPWTWAIAYRRFKQGVLIRFEEAGAVGTGTLIRLTSYGLTLGVGFLVGTVPGVIVASAASAIGVVAEAVYAGLRARSVVRGPLRRAPVTGDPLTLRTFLDFYVPLALTSILNLLGPPVISAALSRMPQALDSLAIWPVVTGLLFLLRSGGIAYNEVVVALLGRPEARRHLRRFALLIGLASTLLWLGIAATPVAEFWFQSLSALSPRLAELARRSFWLVGLMPALAVFRNWHQGRLVNRHRTRAITEAVALYLVVLGLIQGVGIALQLDPGAFVGLLGLSIAELTQVVWLWFRSRRVDRPTLQRSNV